ncbi:flagellar motor protein PomA [Nitrosococcus watsonii]|uniref:MotA/TolQ/ExbB proton channel n=1 Tax=Nitrosococcus watsoni (strain C-113) TaxID=105559 RepID=D8K8I4_NITWC|nr:flagellar motor protein PomA [Nitrosococcus watsonii]ADJ29104.1 MotA/TolQ/ExbB proton channel [Nitrosococcus watsonii C-113]
MDLATLLGLIGSFGVVGGAILLGSSVLVFFNPPSLLIVLGGTTAVVLMKFSLSQFLGSFKIAMKAFMYKTEKPEGIIKQAVEMAGTARKEGLLALEGWEIKNEFMKKGVTLLVDGHDPEMVRRVLMTDLRQTLSRHELGQKIFKAIGDVAPAMGMIGTLIGLVQMLSSMDDPKKIGPAMAVALLTTLYGAMIANMVALPFADKLALRSNEERLNRSIIIESILSIQQGHNPRVLEELLLTFMPGSRRNNGYGEKGR